MCRPLGDFKEGCTEYPSWDTQGHLLGVHWQASLLGSRIISLIVEARQKSAGYGEVKKIESSIVPI